MPRLPHPAGCAGAPLQAPRPAPHHPPAEACAGGRLDPTRSRAPSHPHSRLYPCRYPTFSRKLPRCRHPPMRVQGCGWGGGAFCFGTREASNTAKGGSDPHTRLAGKARNGAAAGPGPAAEASGARPAGRRAVAEWVGAPGRGAPQKALVYGGRRAAAPSLLAHMDGHARRRRFGGRAPREGGPRRAARKIGRRRPARLRGPRAGGRRRAGLGGRGARNKGRNTAWRSRVRLGRTDTEGCTSGRRLEGAAPRKR
ncbi:MAG: hypothetical protein J3K34DRAFT_220325 [Monoraphidium minutum]|nr:MAG: hypothetical protein J3K34DRAFT_220325 [Monoraphidium minutum]